MNRLIYNREGAVRAFIAIEVVSISLAVIAGAGFYLLVTGETEAGVAMLSGTVGTAMGTVVGFYFGQRGANS